MPWLRHRLRDADVWARVDDNAALIKDSDGRVEIVYKPAGGAKVYRAGARNLTPAPGSEPVEFEPGEPAEPRPRDARPAAGPGGASSATSPSRGSARPASRRASSSATTPADAIHVWTDGACSGNPGQAGLGVVIVGDGPGQRELSEYLGDATNNIAELTAIL